MIQPLSEEDIGALLALCVSGEEFGCRNRAITLLCLDRGLRDREAGIQEGPPTERSFALRPPEPGSGKAVSAGAGAAPCLHP